MRLLRIITVTLCVLFIASSAIAEQSGNLRYSITVTKFENRSGWHGMWDLGDTYGAILTDSLYQTGKFIVLGEKDMRMEAMQEQDFGASGRTAGGKKTPKIGQMTPAQLLVKGEITHFQHSTTGGGGGLRIKGFNLGGKTDRAEINAVVYVVDSTTGQVVASKTVTGKASRTKLDVGYVDKDWGTDLGGFKKTNVGKAVQQSIDEAVEFIIAQLEDIAWTGTVIMTKGNKIYINRGTREGVSIGQSFVVGDVEELRDPDTGELLDQSMEQVGTVVVEQVKEKIAICKATSGAGAIEKGMTIMLH